MKIQKWYNSTEDCISSYDNFKKIIIWSIIFRGKWSCLYKSLYELKQAPRQWNKRIIEFMCEYVVWHNLRLIYIIYI